MDILLMMRVSEKNILFLIAEKEDKFKKIISMKFIKLDI